LNFFRFGRDALIEAQRLAALSQQEKTSLNLLAENPNSQHEEISWDSLRTAVFDCPDKSSDGDYLFEKAHARIFQFVAPDHPFVISSFSLLFFYFFIFFIFDVPSNPRPIYGV
jgi:hypothetical protein